MIASIPSRIRILMEIPIVLDSSPQALIVWQMLDNFQTARRGNPLPFVIIVAGIEHIRPAPDAVFSFIIP